MATFIEENHIIFRCCEEVKRICYPVEQSFGVNFFSYFRLYWDGRRFSLSSRKDWMTYYFENKLYLDCDGVPDFRRKKILFSDECDYSTPYGQQVLTQADKLFDIHHFVTIIKHNLGYSDLITFGAPQSQVNFITTFLKNENYFQRFVVYFKDQAKHLLAEAKQSRYSLPVSKITFAPTLSCPAQAAPLPDLPIERVYLDGEFEGAYLTSREVDCLNLLRQELSFKEIAFRLGISSRTVQEYIDKIRLKLKCDSKSKLIDILKNSPVIIEALTINQPDEKQQYLIRLEDYYYGHMQFQQKADLDDLLQYRPAQEQLVEALSHTS